jgi:hypothetical protein
LDQEEEEKRKQAEAAEAASVSSLCLTIWRLAATVWVVPHS